jgi:hypothetical protein
MEVKEFEITNQTTYKQVSTMFGSQPKKKKKKKKKKWKLRRFVQLELGLVGLRVGRGCGVSTVINALISGFGYHRAGQHIAGGQRPASHSLHPSHLTRYPVPVRLVPLSLFPPWFQAGSIGRIRRPATPPPSGPGLQAPVHGGLSTHAIAWL